MSNPVIYEGLLITFDPNAINKFSVNYNTTENYMPASEIEQLVLSALNKIYSEGGPDGVHLFNSMLDGQTGTAQFAIGITGGGSSTIANGLYDFRTNILNTIDDVYVMWLGIDDVPAGDQYNGVGGCRTTPYDQSLYMGVDEVLHSHSIDRVIAHELSRNVLDTRDISLSNGELELISYQNNQNNYYTN